MNKLSKIFDRVDVTSILKSHLHTFYHYEKLQFYNEKKIPWSDKFIFGIFPILFAVLLVLSGLKFNKDYVNIVLTCLSIFIGLLFGLLTLIFGLVQSNQDIKINDANVDLQKRLRARIDLTIDLFINIAFSILLSILALVLVLFTQFYPITVINFLKSFQSYNIIKASFIYITNGLSFFLLIEFLLVILMIIRRFMVLFLNQVGR